MPERAPIEFHPFMADRFRQALVPAAEVLVVDHDARPLERLIDHAATADAKWLDVAAARAALQTAREAVKPLPEGTLPEELIAAHEVGYDPHTGRDIIAKPPEWSRALNRVAGSLCVATRKTAGWNGAVMAATDGGETLDKFVAAARALTPEAHKWYGKLASGMLAWMQGGEVRGFLTREEVTQLRKALEANERQMFMWKEKGGDFHRRKVQAFCYLAEKHAVGLAAVERR